MNFQVKVFKLARSGESCCRDRARLHGKGLFQKIESLVAHGRQRTEWRLSLLRAVLIITGFGPFLA